MANKHINETLIEANKSISTIIDKVEKGIASPQDKQQWIDDLNTIIRQLDHIVEDLEQKD